MERIPMYTCEMKLSPNDHLRLWLRSLDIEEKDNLLIAALLFERLQKELPTLSTVSQKHIQTELFIEAGIYTEKCEERILEILKPRLLAIRNVTNLDG